MKNLRITPVFLLVLLVVGCATDEPRYASPPPGSHSPFASPDERDSVGAERDRPDLAEEPEEEEEEEPDEPVERE